jgi:hypothetical protein
MAKIRSGFLSFLKALWDNDRDTGIEVERTADDDTVRVHAGGNTDIIKVTSAKVYINADGDIVDFQIDGDTETNVLFVKGTASAVGFGTNDPTYVREGGTRATRFGSLKADSAISNAGFFALASNTSARAVDIEFLKCSGTWASKGTVANGEIILNMGSLGHDGTDFNRSAVMQTFVDGAVSANVVPMGWAWQTSETNGGGTINRLRIRANGVVQLGGPIGTPSVTMDSVTGATVFNEQGDAAGDLRIEWDTRTHGFFSDSSAESIGINNSAPSGAYMHFGAGTTTKAPFKYTSGTSLTTPDNGTKEYDGSNEFLTVGGVRYTLAKTLTATATLDFGSIAAGATETLTITVTGAVSGDVVNLGVPNASMDADIDYFAWVSANDTASIRCRNFGAGAVDPPSGTFRVSIIKY